MANRPPSTNGVLALRSLLPPPADQPRGGSIMSMSGRYEARFDAGLKDIRVFDADGTPLTDDDAVYLVNMLGEAVDEMDRRGFDPNTARFTIDRRAPAGIAGGAQT